MDLAAAHASDFDTLVSAALSGDASAWEVLVDRLKGAAWSVIHGFRLPEEDRKDAFAATFFRLYERLGTVRDPERLPGWVATTARNEVHALLRARRRTDPVEFDDTRVPVVDDTALTGLLAEEVLGALRVAFARLSEACQQLLRLLTADPPCTYADVHRQLGMPVGSIGPTRQRCLQQLRQAPEMRAFLAEAMS